MQIGNVPQNRADPVPLGSLLTYRRKEPGHRGWLFILSGAAVLTDNDRHSLLHKGGLQQIHILTQFRIFRIAPPGIGAFAPAFVLLQNGKGGGNIIVHRNSAAICRIAGHSEHGITGKMHIGIISGNQKMALFVVAAGAAHNIHKGLIHLIAVGVRFVLAVCAAPLIPDILPVKLLVLGFKHQLIPIIPEFIAKLGPDGGILLHAVVVIIRQILQPASVPVQIHYDIHILCQRPVNDLADSGLIGRTDGVGAVGRHKVGPGHRHTQNPEALIRIALDDLPGDRRTAPGCFIGIDRAVPHWAIQSPEDSKVLPRLIPMPISSTTSKVEISRIIPVSPAFAGCMPVRDAGTSSATASTVQTHLSFLIAFPSLKLYIF